MQQRDGVLHPVFVRYLEESGKAWREQDAGLACRLGFGLALALFRSSREQRTTQETLGFGIP